MKEKNRCPWCLKGNHDIYLRYHDEEWGVPLYDDQLLFEFLVLESFQAGLSWLTVLRKRENFRKAFLDFDATKISKFKQKKIDSLMKDAEIIRNRLKIEAAINNASCFLKIQKEFGSFAKYVWSFTNEKTIVNQFRSLSDYKSRTEVSDAMSENMGTHGFKFIGSTICYSFMQAIGITDDHTADCFRKRELATLRKQRK